MDVVNNAAQTVVTSAVIFAALVTLGGWIFKWFARRVEEKDAVIREMTVDVFEHLAASTNAMNELVREMRDHREDSQKILKTLEGCPRKGTV